MINRRELLASLLALPFSAPGWALATTSERILKPIPSSGEKLPVIGMGSYRSFDVSLESEDIRSRTAILEAFFKQGGALIDSSPMYRASEEVIGECLTQLESQPSGLFSATKVWTPGKRMGISQMQHSQKLWGVDRFDLLQIHNLLDWEKHLDTLIGWKEEGRVRYIGMTTSHGRRHEELEQMLKSQPLDFVQLTYNMLDREVEQRLLPIAHEKGIAVIVNRPFQAGSLFRKIRRTTLPAFAQELGCANWAQYFLKFVVSHPAVTCAIPATSRVDHMLENMGAGYGLLPDSAARARMAQHFQTLV